MRVRVPPMGFVHETSLRWGVIEGFPLSLCVCVQSVQSVCACWIEVGGGGGGKVGERRRVS